MKTYFFVGLSVLILTACSQGPVSLRYGDESAKFDSQNPKTMQSFGPLGFQEVNQKIFSKYCQSCHSRENPILGNYQDYLRNLGQVRSQIANRKMPKKTQMTDTEIQMVLAWIDSGAPEVAQGIPSADPGLGQKPGQKITWEILKKSYFDAKCNNCHFAGNKEGISSYEDLAVVRETMGTIFYATVITSSMPPAPKGSDETAINPNQLTADEKRMLSEWVIQGMPSEAPKN